MGDARQHPVTAELQKYLPLRTQEDLFVGAEVVSHTCRRGKESSLEPFIQSGGFLGNRLRSN